MCPTILWDDGNKYIYAALQERNDPNQNSKGTHWYKIISTILSSATGFNPTTDSSVKMLDVIRESLKNSLTKTKQAVDQSGTGTIAKHTTPGNSANCSAKIYYKPVIYSHQRLLIGLPSVAGLFSELFKMWPL